MNKLFIVRLQPEQKGIHLGQKDNQGYKIGHKDYIESLVQNRRILFGGPIVDKPGGMLIVQGLNLEEVEKIFSIDPMIEHGYLTFDINEWQINHGKLPIPEIIEV